MRRPHKLPSPSDAAAATARQLAEAWPRRFRWRLVQLSCAASAWMTATSVVFCVAWGVPCQLAGATLLRLLGSTPGTQPELWSTSRAIGVVLACVLEGLRRRFQSRLQASLPAPWVPLARAEGRPLYALLESAQRGLLMPRIRRIVVTDGWELRVVRAAPRPVLAVGYHWLAATPEPELRPSIMRAVLPLSYRRPVLAWALHMRARLQTFQRHWLIPDFVAESARDAWLHFHLAFVACTDQAEALLAEAVEREVEQACGMELAHASLLRCTLGQGVRAELEAPPLLGEQPQPPADLLQSIHERLRAAWTPRELAYQQSKLALPAGPARRAALQAAPPPWCETPAAAANLLPTAAWERLTEAFSTALRAAQQTLWRDAYDAQQERLKRIEALLALEAANQLEDWQFFTLGCHLADARRPHEAETYLELAVEDYVWKNHEDRQLAYAKVLLQTHKERGLALMSYGVMDHTTRHALEGFAIANAVLRREGRLEEAAQLARWRVELLKIDAEEEAKCLRLEPITDGRYTHFDASRTYEAHGLSSAGLEAVLQCLRPVDDLQSAYLVQRNLGGYVGIPLYVLLYALRPGMTRWTPPQRAAVVDRIERALDALPLSDDVECSILSATPEHVPPGLCQTIAQLPGARIL